MGIRGLARGLCALVCALAWALGCGGDRRGAQLFGDGDDGVASAGSGDSATSGGDDDDDDGDSLDDGISFDFADGNGDEGGGEPGGDPKTCEEAEEFKTYIGCDFWPTVTANAVWPIFDFAVVVANAGDSEVEVTVEQGDAPIGGVTVIPPNELRTIWLPWVDALKGPAADACGEVTDPLAATVRAANGAYHLVSSRPVTVYQFSALEYAPEGGPEGKDWSSCPAAGCTTATVGCYSYSNDASLLLPSTALTTNYRVTSYPGWQAANLGATLSVTGIVDGTTVKVEIASHGATTAGPGIVAGAAGDLVEFTVDRGEVVELVGTPTADLSGSLVQSDQPVQVIAALPCTQVPYGNTACDHVEESVFPAETLGTHYFVTVPTSPDGAPKAHLVRIYGNVDGTKLTYPTGKPAGFPDVIDAGQVVEIGKAELVVEPFQNPPYHWDLSVAEDFEIEGDHEFAVATFQFGAAALGTDIVASPLGDPAQSLAIAVEQYRKKYVFLAPLDYSKNFVDIVQPMAADVELDGAPAMGVLTPIGASGYGVRRVQLDAGKSGAHVLVASEPVGIQVSGYGEYTSYQYPGGLNLDVIAPPPPPAG
ncbi:MAG TPA: IgGFc-binding protein [Nannocystaceae bacterium]|nr:IgGFc-binding protein [Nannocystaceae bacterium]